MASHHPVADGAEDTELDDLLDSALEDFKKPAARGEPLPSNAPPSSTSEPVMSSTDTSHRLHTQSSSADLFDELLRGDMSDDPSLVEFGSAMKDFLQKDPEMMKDFDRLMQEAANVNAEDTSKSHKDFTDRLTQTLAGMAPDASGSADSEFMRAFSDLNLDQGAATNNGFTDLGFLPMFQGMMQTLMSKEVLYPALKEMSAKYPPWIKEHRSTLADEQLAAYVKQLELMRVICGEFEQETASDSPDVKSRRFEKIVDLMQRMQELGQPPQEIVGEMAPGGLPSFGSGSQSECSVM